MKDESRHVISKFTWGQGFHTLNHELLESYSRCTDSASVVIPVPLLGRHLSASTLWWRRGVFEGGSDDPMDASIGVWFLEKHLGAGKNSTDEYQRGCQMQVACQQEYFDAWAAEREERRGKPGGSGSGGDDDEGSMQSGERR